jgi:serine/threonine-protein kinase
MTMRDVILGTASYMAPEQAKGRPVDRRVDIWACGCVLYEILTGVRAFESEDATETIAAVVSKEPDWTALPASTPMSIRRLLRRMLVKDPKHRIDSAAVVRLELAEAAAALKSGTPAADAVSEAGARRWWSLQSLAAASLVAGLAGALATWAAMPGPATPAVAPLTRYSLTLPTALALSYGAPDIALSPDATHLAFTLGLQSQLMIRAFDQLEAIPVAGITGARAPFFSPDGRWVAYFDQGGELRKVSVDGGRPITVCKVDGASRGASWGDDNVIVFATSNSRGLLSVSAAGGEPSMVAAVNAGEGGYQFPSVLPDGHGIVFTVMPDVGIGDAPYVLHLDRSGQRSTLLRDAKQAAYLAGGYLTYVSAQSLWAIRFSPTTRQVSGAPVRVVDDVDLEGPRNALNVAVSRRGTLAYVRGLGDQERSLAWISRAGVETAIAAPPRDYRQPRLSPDDTRVVAVVPDWENDNSDLWTWDLSQDAADQTLRPFTFGPGFESYPVWAPDGRIVYNASPEGVSNIHRRTGDLTGAEERLTRSPNAQRPTAVSADRHHLIFEERTPNADWNLMQLALDGASTPEPLLTTPYDERNAVLSPDGRWMAYDSNESGQEEVYVRPFPDVKREVYQVSLNGGRSPAWSHKAGELFFVNGSTLHAAAVTLAPTFRHGRPVALFDRPSVLWDARGQTTRGAGYRMYDVSKDGQRFLVAKIGADNSAMTRRGIVVVHNWFENQATLPR